MREKADLVDKTENLEHIIMQLQGESDTIGRSCHPLRMSAKSGDRNVDKMKGVCPVQMFQRRGG